MKYYCHNDQFYSLDTPSLTPENASYKWGDGIFETMRLRKGQIDNEHAHLSRLTKGLRITEIDSGFNSFKKIRNNILELCQRNKCSDLARVRLSFYRQENNGYGYAIEASALQPEVLELNDRGLKLGFFEKGVKALDTFANIKSSSFQLYTMAHRFAEKSGLDDAIVLNSSGGVADSSRANIFIIIDGKIFTPSLDQGCVEGCFRALVIHRLRHSETTVNECAVSQELLLAADEMFITNAVYGIRWVESFDKKTYSCDLVKEIYAKVNHSNP